MNNIIISVGSVTYAIKLKKLLAREGIKTTLVKKETASGCTHGVELSEGDFLGAVVIMRENGIAYTVYKQ